MPSPSHLRSWLAVTALAAAAHAGPITVVNPSFESPDLGNNYTWGGPTGWDWSGDAPGAGYITNGYGGNTAFNNATGNQLALFYVNRENNTLTRGYLRQTLGTVQANTSYTAQVDAGRLSTVPGNSGATFDFTLAWGQTDGGEGSGTLVRGTVTFGDTTTSTLTTFTINTGMIAADNPAVGRDLTIWLLGSGADNDGVSCDFVVDNVQVNSGVIPEPGMLSLLAVGGLLAVKRRRTAGA